MDIPERIATQIKIDSIGRAFENGSTRVQVFCDDIGARDYAVPLFIPTAQMSGTEDNPYEIAPDETFFVLLDRGNLKPNKDGAWPNHFYWNWAGIADPNDTLDPGMRATGAVTARTQAPQRTALPQVITDRDTIIVDQVLFKGAIDLQKGGVSVFDSVRDALETWDLVRGRHIISDTTEEDQDDVDTAN